MFSTALRTGTRRFTTSAVRRSNIHTDGQPGSNLPFGYSFKNKYLFTIGFTLFWSSGLVAPLIAIRQRILRK